MELKKSLPIIATSLGIIALTASGQASARSCDDVSLHAEKLTLQAERYQQRAAQLNPGEHEKFIRALKRRANNMRAKAMSLIASCAPPHHEEHQHFHY